MKGEPITFQWHEHPVGNFGPGVSRPAKPERAKPFVLHVKHGNARPMKVTLLAESSKLAVRYAEARWPGAAVEVAA
jgi:hypothetical protein